MFNNRRSFSPQYEQNITQNNLKYFSPNISSYATIDSNINHPIISNRTSFNYSPMNNNNNMQRSPTQFWDKTRGPYGVSFEDMELHRKYEQRQYKDDLEYLMSLKNQRHGDMSQKEWESYNRKLHYMNDRYAYGELDRINFLRGMMKGYETEYNLKKENKRKRKELEDAEDRKRLVDVGAIEKDEKEKEREKKRKLYNVQMDDLDNFNRRKAANSQRKKEEDEKLLQNFPKESDKWELPYNQMRNKIKNNNDRIYGNISKYNNLLGKPIDPSAFNAKNDLEFNRIIADQKAKKRKDEKLNPNLTEEILKQNKEIQDDARKKRENDLNRQKLYKEYLDNQNELDKLNKLKNKGDDMRPQLLMPSYYYPNLPEPIYHKARDSLLASKDQENYFGKDMNRFFRRDASQNTLLDYEGTNRYLGDSKLRHNPITCPVNDYYYNKYVNKLKKESEIVPNNIRTQDFSRENLIQRGQYVIK